MSQVKIISLLIHHHLWQQINKIICIIYKTFKTKAAKYLFKVKLVLAPHQPPALLSLEIRNLAPRGIMWLGNTHLVPRADLPAVAVAPVRIALLLIYRSFLDRTLLLLQELTLQRLATHQSVPVASAARS